MFVALKGVHIETPRREMVAPKFSNLIESPELRLLVVG